MRRSNRTRFGGQTAPPPPPVAITAPILPLQDLQTAYDWMVLDKIASFRLAIEWYNKHLNSLLFRVPLTTEQQKTYDRAKKAQELGSSSNINGEKVQAWSTAIHLYEKIWTAKNLPQLDPALNSISPSPAVQNILKVIDNLNGVFSQYGCKFRATFSDSRELSEGEILIPYKDLDRMVSKQPFRVALDEVPTVCKVISLVHADGKVSLDGTKFMTQLPILLTSVGEYAANREAFKALGKSAFATLVQSTKTRAPKAPSTPGTPIAASGKVSRNMKIRIINLALSKSKGARQAAVMLIKDGMTVAEYAKAIVAANLDISAGPSIARTVAFGAITLEP